ncbi:TetR/AcrR family transcriptional regulator [Williamsia maris]|uniref:Transcriptional regulator, TetR family n=1 Tax=Williamsia maris TaxID=72806 RepID=A0ABT1HBI1_9NOCA|nr:TetR family transcriptional regulator C-terminal domain-containing protein [Williamsia maris]MCP2175618.1 transcriptional regulator, TetR family [Williamsia maris]
MTADAARHRVSRAVWDTVAELGIEATTVRAVAARADCTTGLIMHRFGSRSAMLVHARQTLFDRTATRADGVDAGEPAAKRLLAVACTVLPLDDVRMVEARIFTGFAAASIADAELRELHVHNTRQWLERITGLVADLGSHVTDVEATEWAQEIVATMEGIAVLAVLDSPTYPAAAQERLARRTIADVVERIRGATA